MYIYTSTKQSEDYLILMSLYINSTVKAPLQSQSILLPFYIVLPYRIQINAPKYTKCSNFVFGSRKGRHRAVTGKGPVALWNFAFLWRCLTAVTGKTLQ